MSSTEERLAVLASPARARSLFTVLAAISSARSSGRPRSSKPSLMCSYWRSRLAFHAFCGMPHHLRHRVFPRRRRRKRGRRRGGIVVPLRRVSARPSHREGDGQMTTLGYKLSCEERTAAQLVEDARSAEEAGFPFAMISDHFHP